MFHALIAVTIGFSALISNPAGAARAAFRAAPLSQSATGMTSVFRIRITVATARDDKRLAALGVIELAPADENTLTYPRETTLLATGAQMERLARMGMPALSADELGNLAESNLERAAWVAEGVQPLLNRSFSAMNTAQVDVIAQAAALATVQTAMSSLSSDTRMGIASLISVDDDGDGLTNTQEMWWCTNASNANSNPLGTLNDSQKVQQAKDWIKNLRSGPPDQRPFAGWPMKPDDANYNASCQDSDQDGVPDYAERWELGLRPDRESTTGDKFDDGMKLWGTTPAGWGSLPRAADAGVISNDMPTWVGFPGKHPFAAAFPELKVSVSPTFTVQLVTNVTTEQNHSANESRLYSTSITTGTSTSVANTESWNNWQETSVSTPQYSQLAGRNSIASPDIDALGWVKLGGSALAVAGAVGGVICTIATVGACLPLAVAGLAGAVVALGAEAKDQIDKDQADAKANACDKDADRVLPKCVGKFSSSQPLPVTAPMCTLERASSQNMCPANQGTTYSSSQPQSGPVQNTARTNFQISYPVQKQVPTVTTTSGSSHGTAVTTETSQHEDHTVTNGNQWGTTDGWSNATAVDSAHAADFWFSYKLQNAGTDYALGVTQLAFNIYLGDDPNPICTYYVGSNDCGTPPTGGGALFTNLAPNSEINLTAHRIPLTLDQLKGIDLGGKIRIVLAQINYGSDELYYANARGGSVLVAIEDGTDDGDEAIDTYLIPTWGDGDTMQDVIGCYFPSQQDDAGEYIAIWTPENTNGSVPAWCVEPKHYGVSPQVWCKHALSTSDWWNIYLNNLGDGTSKLSETPAAPNSTAFFRFNKDTDLDGYSDRTEDRLGTNPDDAADHPKPELLAGVHRQPAVNSVITATASLLNTGLYDAYGVELIMVAPDDSITILNNTVGGSGRVKAGKQVIVGSTTKVSPLPAAWTQAGHAKPSAGGYYTGNADRVYTFTASCANPGGCDVGSAGNAPALNWNDGAGGTVTLVLSSTYASPSLLNVGAFGVQLSLLSGKIYNNETFSMTARPPLDTFSYRINRTPYTEPLVIASYNDPQGNHRFIVPPNAMSLASPTQNLAPFGGQMLQDPGVEIVTTSPFTPATAQTVTLMLNNPSGVTLTNAHVFLEFVNISGTVAAEFPYTATLQAGPNVITMDWNTAQFSPAFTPSEDYIVLAFFTDYQGNILDTSGRPLSSFQVDPKPAFAMSTTDVDWDFGTAAQGTLLKRNITLGNAGLLDLLTYINGVPGLSLSQTGSRSVGPADVTNYELALNTQSLSLGAYDQTFTIRSSDPARPAQTVRVHGTVSPAVGNTQPGPLLRPLDVSVVVSSGVQGSWITYTHNLGPNPQSLHPMKVYTDYTASLVGVGKYATDFSAGTASAEMFGDGRDGVMPSSGNLDNANGAAAGIVNSGSAGSTSITVSEAWAVFRINPGDVVLIHQTQGTNAGNWELNKAASDFTGNGTFTLQKPLQYTYSTSGNNKAQIVRVPQYSTCNVTGTVTPLAGWNGSWGGILAVMCNSTMNVSGVISVDGGNGFTADPTGSGGSGGGYRGGAGTGDYGWTGEGSVGPSVRQNIGTPNGNGGGAGHHNGNSNNIAIGGGGGGNGTQGDYGNGGQVPGGAPGSVAGSGDLVNMVFGGGGGGAGRATSYGGTSSGGGAGGGIAVMIVRSIVVNESTGAIHTNGGLGATGDGTQGGSGAGGSILLKVQETVLGFNRITALGGAKPLYGNGGGGNGRVRIEYCDSYSGSTNPSASTQKLNCYIAEQIESAPYTQGRQASLAAQPTKCSMAASWTSPPPATNSRSCACPPACSAAFRSMRCSAAWAVTVRSASTLAMTAVWTGAALRLMQPRYPTRNSRLPSMPTGRHTARPAAARWMCRFAWRSPAPARCCSPICKRS